MDLNNPAERLLGIVHSFHVDRSNQTPFTRSCRLWDLDENDHHDQLIAIKRLAEIVDLTDEVRRRADRIPRFGPILLANFDQIEVVAFNLASLSRSHNLDHAFGALTPAGWAALEQLRDALADDGRPHLELASGATDDLLGQVMRLIVQVRDDDTLSDEQRTSVLDHLLRVQESLLSLDITGPEKVELAVDGLRGGMIRLALKFHDFRAHPVVREVVALVAAIALVLEVGDNWPAMDAGSWPLIEIAQRDDVGGQGGGGSS